MDHHKYGKAKFFSERLTVYTHKHTEQEQGDMQLKRGNGNQGISSILKVVWKNQVKPRLLPCSYYCRNFLSTCSDTYEFIIIFLAKEWCCSTLRKYPDLIPLVKWGNTITASEKKTWTASGCNDKVGGDQCPGTENIYMKSKVILLKSCTENWKFLS